MVAAGICLIAEMAILTYLLVFSPNDPRNQELDKLLVDAEAAFSHSRYDQLLSYYQQALLICRETSVRSNEGVMLATRDGL